MLQSEFIPAEERDSKKLLIVLHGLGDSAAGYRWVPRVLQIPWLNYLLVNAPDGYYGGFSWYDFAADPGPGIERSYKALIALLDDMREKGFPSDQTILSGFSQGCLMSIETTLRYNNLLGGVVGISGYVHEPEQLLKAATPVSKSQVFLITHGTRDPLIPIREVRQQIEMLKNAGYNITWREYEKDHTIVEPEIADIRQFVVDRLGATPRR